MRICTFVPLLLLAVPSAYAQLDCNAPDRYRDTLFTDAQIETFDVVFANFMSDQLWNGGDTVNTTCFDPRKYLTPLADSTWNMAFTVYRPMAAFDDCTSRPGIVFVHGGGYNYAASANDGTTSIATAMDLAKRGYVVCNMNYRKGWDIRAALNSSGLLPLLPGCQNCPCDAGNTTASCEAFTFMQMNYTMMQDTRAAHRKALNEHVMLGIDPDKIFYLASSTGSTGAMHAAYAADDMPAFISPNGQSLQAMHGDPDVFGEAVAPGLNFNVSGISVHAGSIHDLNWIENTDDVPLNMVHSTLDEAIKYCAGNVLDMVYFQLGNPNQYLNLQGAGKIYKHVRCNSQGTNSLTKIRLTTAQGLYHALTAPLGSTDPSDNCDEFNSFYEAVSPAAHFYADLLDGTPFENEHIFIAQAQVSRPCLIGDSATYTPCTNYNPCSLSVRINEHGGPALAVHPNPASAGTWVTLSADVVAFASNIQLIDPVGRRIHLKTDDRNSVEIPLDLAKGKYHIAVSIEHRVAWIPLVVR